MKTFLIIMMGIAFLAVVLMVACVIVYDRSDEDDRD